MVRIKFFRPGMSGQAGHAGPEYSKGVLIKKKNKVKKSDKSFDSTKEENTKSEQKKEKKEEDKKENKEQGQRAIKVLIKQNGRLVEGDL